METKRKITRIFETKKQGRPESRGGKKTCFDSYCINVILLWDDLGSQLLREFILPQLAD